MKTALVNLTKISDYAQSKRYQEDIAFLKDNDIDYIDYCSGYSTKEELLNGFHEALRNPDVDFVWFVQGGTTLIKFMIDIDWDLVASTNKTYGGVSDFTHFSYKAVQLGKICYYGIALKDICKYWPTPEDRQYIVYFLKEGKVSTPEFKVLSGNAEYNLANESIIGGHMFISTLMLQEAKPDLSDKFLLLEHHYIPGEAFDDLEYFLDQVLYVIRNNTPKGFVLGHSLLFENGEPMNYEKINEFLVAKLSHLGKPIFAIDHFRNIVKLCIS